jgi:acyl transferase domain-containing protein
MPMLTIFSQLGALSRREEIRPFDKDADGTLLGEGLGFVVLKRLADAERDKDRIYAVIKGVGVASDGRAVGVMAPRLEGEELAMQKAYRAAGVSPQTVGLIEAHGTGTPVGDFTEIEALKSVFGPRTDRLPNVAVGTVKSMISHTVPAAGVAGMIKASLALRHKVLPPTLHCEEPNPRFELEKTPFYINTETRPWLTIEGLRRAGVSAFGFGGINAHVVLEEYREPEASGSRGAR